MVGMKLFKKQKDSAAANASISKRTAILNATVPKAACASQVKLIDAVFENRSEAASSTDEETLTLESSLLYVNHGSLIAPTPRRINAFHPPKSMFDGIPKHVGGFKSKSVIKLLPWKRNQSTTSTISSQSSFTLRSPYNDTFAISKLSPALGNSGQLKGSAWERPSCTLPQPLNDTDKIAPPSIVEMNVPLSTSDSFTLPVVISPAYKFVPIGYSSDEDECSFNSFDYDICRSNSDISIDNYSSDMKALNESRLREMGQNSFADRQSEERMLDAGEGECSKASDDLTPFEMDQHVPKHSKEECEAPNNELSKARSSSPPDSVSEEFSIVSSYGAEPTESQSKDNADCTTCQNETNNRQSNYNDLWLLWEKLGSLISCGSSSIY